MPGQQIELELAGFNAILAAVAVFALVEAANRLALLGAIVATAVLPAFSKAGLIPGAAGFVVTTWAIILFGWFQTRYINPRTNGGLTRQEAAK